MKNIEEKVNTLLSGLADEIKIHTSTGECTIEITVFPKNTRSYRKRLMLVLISYIREYGYMGHIITNKKITYFKALPYIGLVDNLEEHIEILTKGFRKKGEHINTLQNFFKVFFISETFL